MIITVADDGRGIDAARVAAKAAERGLIGPTRSTRSTCARAIELLFTAGFSTAEVTSDISGRGVGMDAVRAAIRGLGGEVINAPAAARDPRVVHEDVEAAEILGDAEATQRTMLSSSVTSS